MATQTKVKYELDHATDNGVRHFIIHGPLPNGLNDKWGYPICDSMNRHHCISPEEDEANGQLILRGLNILGEKLKYRRVLLGEEGDKKDFFFEIWSSRGVVFQTICREVPAEEESFDEDERFCRLIAEEMSALESARLDL